jgi:hypothetical protein
VRDWWVLGLLFVMISAAYLAMFVIAGFKF